MIQEVRRQVGGVLSMLEESQPRYDPLASSESFEGYVTLVDIHTDCVALTRFLDHAANVDPLFTPRLTSALREFGMLSRLGALQALLAPSDRMIESAQSEEWHKSFQNWIDPFLHDEPLMRSLTVYPVRPSREPQTNPDREF